MAAATEDFGLSPLEAMAFGTPVVAMRHAGYLETIVEGETGVFFDRAEPADIADAIRVADRHKWSEMRLVDHAHQFSEYTFTASMRRTVSDVAGHDLPQLEPAEDHVATRHHANVCRGVSRETGW